MFEDRIAALNKEETEMPLPYEKRIYTVDEIQDILGIGRNAAYNLVKSGVFHSVRIGGNIRISKKSFDRWLGFQREVQALVDSFEKWYDNQLHYRKVDGTPPGKNWTGITFSVREVAEMLGISDSNVYGLLKKKVFRTARVGQATRIYKDSFEEWYQSQTYYNKADVHKEVIDG